MKALRFLWAWLTTMVLLAACAPQTVQETSPAFYTNPQGFFPNQYGLDWVYQPQGYKGSDPPYRVSLLGPGVFAGQPSLRFRFTGRGQDRVFHRQISNEGVKLLGFEELITELKATYQPAILEYPPVSLLNVGYRWGGITKLDIVFTLPGNKNEYYRGNLEYNYTVMAKNTVELPSGRYEVFRITLDSKDDAGNQNRQEIWYAPGVGEVRTREGLVLVGRNFQ
jgi:hypothetical protein